MESPLETYKKLTEIVGKQARPALGGPSMEWSSEA